MVATPVTTRRHPIRQAADKDALQARKHLTRRVADPVALVLGTADTLAQGCDNIAVGPLAGHIR